ncbi:MAG TPA: YggT family protein [Candidatus Binatia bacterium]|nr:YggT family protein [Candidatus Binatia bacterium]
MAEFVLGRIVLAVATILDSLLSLYFWIVLIAALLSWVNPDPRNPIVRFLYAVTEPVLYQIRRRLPFVFAGGIDFSPLVLILAIQFTKIVLVQSLYRLAFEITGGVAGSLHAAL